MSLSVLHVVEMNPNKRGPLELQLVEMARQLSGSGGGQVACFSQEAPGWYRELTETAGGGLALVPDAVRLAGELRPDVVHVHFFQRSELLRSLRDAGARHVVLTEHSFRFPQPLAPARALVRRWRTRDVDRFVAVSGYIARQVQRDYLASPRRIRTVLNGIDVRHFRPREDRDELRRRVLGVPPDAIVVAAAAHLHPAKRLDLVLRAAGRLAPDVPDLHVVIAGGGPERERLLALIDELGLAGRAQVLSGDNRVEEIYAASDVGVSASAGEGIGASGIEAMACGLPLVATPAGGQAEIAEDGVSGVLVHDPSPEALATALHPLVTDRELRARMGRAARARAVERFDVERAARETIDVYRELVDGR